MESVVRNDLQAGMIRLSIISWNGKRAQGFAMSEDINWIVWQMYRSSPETSDQEGDMLPC